MSVHEGFRKNAVFLSESDWETVPPTPAGEGLIGTAFFVSVERVLYVVTAKHNIADMREDQPVYLITNKRKSRHEAGGYKAMATLQRDWVQHPDTDLAVCEVSDNEETDATAVPFKWLARARGPTSHDCFIMIGDEVFTVGLYDGFCGSKSIQPIARFGRIALMPNPDEKIRVTMCEADAVGPWEDLPEIEAYLIEANGWEGQSGSPVFVSFGRLQEAVKFYDGTQPSFEGRQPSLRVLRPQPVCIGLIQGYYPAEREDAGERWRFNYSISMVVPADRIIETLMSPEVAAAREARLASSSAGLLPPVEGVGGLVPLTKNLVPGWYHPKKEKSDESD